MSTYLNVFDQGPLRAPDGSTQDTQLLPRQSRETTVDTFTVGELTPSTRKRPSIRYGTPRSSKRLALYANQANTPTYTSQ